MFSRCRRFTCWSFCVIPFSIVPCLLTHPRADAEPKRTVSFNRDVRPILAENCFACHGPDEKKRKAELRLDLSASAIDENAVVVPGKSEKSELYLRIMGKEGHRVMPPRKTNKKLKPQEIELIKRWIDEGAEYQGHWAFEAVHRPSLPTVKLTSWPLTPIDYFILARLEKEGLMNSPRADRRSLIRRVTFDLTGLPPTVAEVEAFVNDRSPNAYEKLVDRLLASPRFGEHKARYWLDVARYGDTHGLHLDNYREVYPYRDWVIRAFNENKRFDQFTIEQIAGDLLPNSTLQQQIASGYNRAHVTTSEGGSIAEEVYVRNVIDRTATTSTVWMGLTAGCAVCHDHKFDPLKQQEFYQLFAFFNSLDGNPLDGNKKDHAPVAKVPTIEQQEQQASFVAQLGHVDKQMATHKAGIDAAFKEWLAKATSEHDELDKQLKIGLLAHYPLDEKNGKIVAEAVDETRKGKVEGDPAWKPGKIGGAFQLDDKHHVSLGDVADFERNEEFSYGAWVNWSGRKGASSPLSRMKDDNAFRGFDVYAVDGQISIHLVHAWPGKLIKVTSRNRIKANQWTHVFATYDGSSKADGVKLYFDGKEQPFVVNNNTLDAPIPIELEDGELIPNSIRTKAELRLGRRSPSAPFFGMIDDVRFYDRSLMPYEVTALAGAVPIAPILAIAAEKRTAQQNAALRSHYLENHDPGYRMLKQRRAGVAAKMDALTKRMPTTLVMKERAAPREAFILNRGQYDQRGDKVVRKTPEFLPPMAKEAPLDRLGLAKWLVDPKHPLTARVAMNRTWQQIFGTGIVKTSEDFGTQGEWPSHPELLDWLASEFVASGWDVKKMTKLLVTSATYQQSARVTPVLRAKDPKNRLLGRGPRFRLDAEMLRDQALTVSRLMVNDIGGPSVKPPQPAGLWYAVGYTSSNTAKFKADTGAKIYRRSVYTFWKRTSPPPQMATFDAPSRESCTIRRERTNTPLQALLLMNERQYVESARNLAQRMMREGGKTAEEKLARGFQIVAARAPSSDDSAELLAAYSDFLAEMQEDPKAAEELIKTGDTPPDATLDKSELAAWTLVANLMLNLDEVLNK